MYVACSAPPSLSRTSSQSVMRMMCTLVSHAQHPARAPAEFDPHHLAAGRNGVLSSHLLSCVFLRGTQHATKIRNKYEYNNNTRAQHERTADGLDGDENKVRARDKNKRTRERDDVRYELVDLSAAHVRICTLLYYIHIILVWRSVDVLLYTGDIVQHSSPRSPHAHACLSYARTDRKYLRHCRTSQNGTQHTMLLRVCGSLCT